MIAVDYVTRHDAAAKQRQRLAYRRRVLQKAGWRLRRAAPAISEVAAGTACLLMVSAYVDILFVVLSN